MHFSPGRGPPPLPPYPPTPPSWVWSASLAGLPVWLSTVDFSTGTPRAVDGLPPAPGWFLEETAPHGRAQRASRQSQSCLLRPPLCPIFTGSPWPLPEAVLRSPASPEPEPWGWTVAPLPSLASSHLGEGGARVGLGRSLPQGGAFTPMVQASRPNLTTWPVILLSQSRPPPDVTLRPQRDSHWPARPQETPILPRPPAQAPRPCCLLH